MKKKDKISVLWIVCAVCMIFLLGRIAVDFTLLVNAQEPAKQELSITYQDYCEEIGARYNLCPELLEAMIEQESSGNPDAVSSGGDIGLMQVNPKWHKDRMDRLSVTALKDPYGNILVAADYLTELFGKYGDLPMVLMTYNGSSDAKERWTSGNFTDYANNIMQRTVELERSHGK